MASTSSSEINEFSLQITSLLHHVPVMDVVHVLTYMATRLGDCQCSRISYTSRALMYPRPTCHLWTLGAMPLESRVCCTSLSSPSSCGTPAPRSWAWTGDVWTRRMQYMLNMMKSVGCAGMVLFVQVASWYLVYAFSILLAYPIVFYFVVGGYT